MNFFLNFNMYDLHIYTSSPSYKNRNFPNLITSDPLDYLIVLIHSLITELYNLTSLITFFHTSPQAGE